MNKQELLTAITFNVRRKHSDKGWYISQERYLKFFGELPREFLDERLAYDNLLDKMKQFKLCQLVLSETKIEIKLNFDQVIVWEISRHEDAAAHNILPSDIKKLLKDA
jgi:hypothetical protein